MSERKRASVVSSRLFVHPSHFPRFNSPPRRASFPFAAPRFERGRVETQGVRKSRAGRSSRGERQSRIATLMKKKKRRRPKTTKTTTETSSSPPLCAALSSTPRRSTGLVPGACCWKTSLAGRAARARARERERAFAILERRRGRKESEQAVSPWLELERFRAGQRSEHHFSLSLLLLCLASEGAATGAARALSCGVLSLSLSLSPPLGAFPVFAARLEKERERSLCRPSPSSLSFFLLSSNSSSAFALS